LFGLGENVDHITASLKNLSFIIEKSCSNVNEFALQLAFFYISVQVSSDPLLEITMGHCLLLSDG